MEVRGQFSGIYSLPLPCEILELNNWIGVLCFEHLSISQEKRALYFPYRVSIHSLYWLSACYVEDGLFPRNICSLLPSKCQVCKPIFNVSFLESQKSYNLTFIATQIVHYDIVPYNIEVLKNRDKLSNGKEYKTKHLIKMLIQNLKVSNCKH